MAKTARKDGCTIAFYAELKTKGANGQGEPVSHRWGLRDFEVLDLEGNCIKFGQPFE